MPLPVMPWRVTEPRSEPQSGEGRALPLRSELPSVREQPPSSPKAPEASGSPLHLSRALICTVTNYTALRSPSTLKTLGQPP